jgi:hypothetical protein
MLASGSTTFSVVNGTQQFIDVFWTNTIAVTPGTQYFVAFLGNTAGLTSRQSQYVNPDGQAYYNYSSTNPTAPYTCCGGGYDLAFRAYALSGLEPDPEPEPEPDPDPEPWVDPNPPIVTPEPASVVLMATGLAGLVAISRRRKRNA